ncbi:GNAT family N-acetyltransferase [Enterovibrio makurazakiensis]|uniref:GNAT family N-acetyltransferase n=1 Tax=Enterovibrio gelatinilyticus TaxID=2899819 RepID=A0ABT5R1U8_9GAMM|nr:GNAT family protein [Enterovibrio sp. ZSDZ42]MDD1793721.1 GNAT family N-acetyltransferase [Enterovibrio sp. ZSDZ42]
MFTLSLDDELSLSLVQHSYAKDYYRIVCGEREYLSEWLAWPPHANGEAFFEQFIKGALHGYAEGKSLTCAMIYQGNVVGNVSFNSISRSLKKVEIGYWLSNEYQGKGIASRCVLALVQLAFDEMGIEKVQIAAATGNQPSRRLCERLGFRLEGVITNAEDLNGRIVDHAIYGLRSGQEEQA